MTLTPPVLTGESQDVIAIRRILEFILSFLGWLLEKRELFTAEEDRTVLQVHFEASVVRPVRQAQEQLGHMSDQQHAQVKAAGLTAISLRTKWGPLFSDMYRGRMKSLLKQVDILLQSLVGVFPGLDTVKEFKGQVEVSMKGLGDDDRPESVSLSGKNAGASK